MLTSNSNSLSGANIARNWRLLRIHFVCQRKCSKRMYKIIRNRCLAQGHQLFLLVKELFSFTVARKLINSNQIHQLIWTNRHKLITSIINLRKFGEKYKMNPLISPLETEKTTGKGSINMVNNKPKHPMVHQGELLLVNISKIKVLSKNNPLYIS